MIARLWDDLEAVAVRRGREHGESWEDLSAALPLSPDRLRKKWTSDAIDRRMDRRPTPPQRPPTHTGTRVFIPHQRPAATESGGVSADDTDPDADTSPPGTTRSPTQQLASALSHLQRRRGGTLRHLAYLVGVHPSYISRIMNGDRDPSWRVTAGLATACAADPEDLLPLWNIVHNVAAPLPATHQEAVARYRSFLRSLHLSAAAPSPDTIRETSNYTLTPAHIARALEGPGIPDWTTTYRLALALRGRPADIRPLWQTAHTLPSTRTTTISAGAFG